jgi:invasion protein IalB
MAFRLPSRPGAALLACLIASGAAAQDAVPTVTGNAATQQQSQANWASRCVASARQAPLECSIEQRLLMANTQQLIAAVTVRIPNDSGQPLLVVQTPLGILLPGGVSIDIDGANRTSLELQTCDNNGCYASVPMSDELLAGMTRGEKFNIGLQNLSKQPVTVSGTLVGFTAAFQRIR